MFKYLLIFLVFWCKIRANDVYTQADTDTDNTLTKSSDFIPCPPTSQLSLNSDKQDTEEPIKKPLTMNGHNNYHVDQQIFYVYDSQFFRRLLSNKKDTFFISDNTDTHKFYPYKATWNQARQACIREGGYLAIINSESEERILSRMLEENKVAEAWLGLHDLFEEDIWVTVMNQNLQDLGYVGWTKKWPNIPDNWQGNQNCAIIIKNEGMDDVDCNVKYNFFCEFSA